MSDLRRHDLSEERWLLLKPHLPGSKGNRGRRGDDDRLFLNALYTELTGAATTNISANCDIQSKMLSSNSNNGDQSQPDTQKPPPLSSPNAKSQP